MTTIRGAGIYGGMPPGQVDTEALAELIRRRTAELAGAAALFAQRTARQDSHEEREAKR